MLQRLTYVSSSSGPRAEVVRARKDCWVFKLKRNVPSGVYWGPTAFPGVQFAHELKEMELDEGEAAIKEGQKLALNGRGKDAKDYFRNLSKKGIPEASVALAQIVAFQGKWDEVLNNGKIFLQNPQISYNYWPFQEAMRKLIVRAVKITGRRKEFEVMLEWSGAVGKAALSCEVWALESWLKGLDEMAVDVGLNEEKTSDTETTEKEPDLTKEEKIGKYEEGMKRTLNDPVLRKDLKHVAKMRFLNAKLYDYEEEMVRVYLENEDAWGKRQIDFDNVMLVAKLLVKSGKDLLAWKVISNKLKTWQPYEYHEVEPIGLLNDDVLFTLMTPQRCDVVLSTIYENKFNDLA